MERGFRKSFDNGKQDASSFKNSLQGSDPRSIVPSPFRDSQSGNSICFAAGSFQNPLADTTAVGTTASSSQNPLTGSDFTCSVCEPSNTGLYEDDFEKPSRKRAKIYCDHCEEYVSKSSWYEHYNKFYSPSTRMWKKETLSKPLAFNFDEEQFSSDECPVMEESDQIYPELNSSSTDAVDEMHPNS